MYRVIFAPGTTLAQINHVRFIKNIKIYWEKYESHKPTIQCFRYQAQVVKLQQETSVKCAGKHDTSSCNKTPETSPTCANCKGAHPVNYFQYPAFLAKKIVSKERTQYVQNFLPNMFSLAQSFSPFYLKQNSHHLLLDSGKPQNKAKNSTISSE